MTSYVVVMGLLILAYYAVPRLTTPGGEALRQWPYGTWIWLAIGLISASAVVIGIVRNRPRNIAPWILLSAAIAVFVAGDTSYDVITYYLGWENPFPSFVDGMYQINYALTVAALILLPHSERGNRDRTALLDALTVTAGLGLLAWVFLIGPYISNGDLTLFEKITSISYPAWDILILATGTRLVASVRKTPSVILLGAGAAGLLAADVLYGLSQLNNTWQSGGPIDLGWFLYYLCWGAAALHPSMRNLTGSRAVWSSDVSYRRIALLTLASLIAPLVLLAESVRGNVEHGVVIAMLSVVIFLLVLVRLVNVVGTHRQALTRERALREAGAALVSAADVTDVVAAVRRAVGYLVRTGIDHRVVVAVEETDGADAGGWRTVMPTSDSGTGRRSTESVDGGATVLVRTLDLDPPTAEALGPFDTTLVRPFAVADSLSGEGIVGALLVSARRDALSALRGSAEVLGSQAALALERIALNNEINRRNNEEYFRTLVHNTADVILIVNDSDRIRYASPSASGMFGRDTLGEVDLLDLVYPEDRGLAARVLDQARGGRDPDTSRAGGSRSRCRAGICATTVLSAASSSHCAM
jgi:PAS domain-containing protein